MEGVSTAVEGLMVWLAFGAFAALGLYLWLRGHWFVRVLVFLGLVPVGVTAAAVLAYWMGISGAIWATILTWLIGGILAWLISGIPLYVQQARMRLMARRYPEARLRLYPEG